jgi:hypothetical protein
MRDMGWLLADMHFNRISGNTKWRPILSHIVSCSFA